MSKTVATTQHGMNCISVYKFEKFSHGCREFKWKVDRKINLRVLQNNYVIVLEEMQKKKVDLSNFGSIKSKSSVYTLVNLFLTRFKISLPKCVLIIKLKNGRSGEK